jgi:formamidopyrimidine-DNA glycosylase
MPELPEVEVIRAGLDEHITGQAIVKTQVHHPRPVRSFSGSPSEFEKALTGKVFSSPRRRGKCLWLPFADGDALVVHLGMSGQFRVAAPDTGLPRHTRVVFTLSGGSQLRFVDQRMFGGLELASSALGGLPAGLTRIAPDLFDVDFDLPRAIERVQATRSAIKRVLLDQRVVSGIGNIYADESLWLAQINPEMPANMLSEQQIVTLLDSAKIVMTRAIAAGGTSFDALYVNVSGDSGYFSVSLNAYGRAGLPCNRCGTLLARTAFLGRSSVFCPECQRLGLSDGAGTAADVRKR